ncbi:MAG: DMT family transporter [Cyanobacteria bacterium P01_A01_bin.83]
MLNKIPGWCYLLVAITIFATSSSISSKLAEIGMMNPIDGRNPISFCNVLFVGNVVALVVLAIVYGKEWNPSSLRRLSWGSWLILIAVAILAAAIAPPLIFLALERTSASNVILLSRIEPPLTFAFLSVILDKKSHWLMFMGALLSVVGILIILILQTPGENSIKIIEFTIGRGELLAIAGAIATAIANITRKACLDHIPLGVFTIFRTAVGTLFFLIVVAKLYTLGHFADVFAPVVWQWITLYGIVIVAGGQIIWFKGLKECEFCSMSYAGYLIPIMSILAAYLILGEVPTVAQYVGGSIILVGAVINQIGIWQQGQRSRSHQLTMNDQIGFRGI